MARRFRNKLSDFGTDQNKFCASAWGHWTKVGNKAIGDDEQRRLDPNVLLEDGSPDNEVFKGGATEVASGMGAVVAIGPIRVTFYIHNPTSAVAMDPSWTLKYFTFTWKAGKLEDEPAFSFLKNDDDGKTFEGKFPYVHHKSGVQVTAR